MSKPNGAWRVFRMPLLLAVVSGVGLVAARGAAPFQTVAVVSAGLAGLALTAAVFGLMAYGMVWVGVRVIGGVFLGGIGGALGGAYFAGAYGILLGAVCGVLGGVILGLLSALHLPSWPRRHDSDDPDL